MARHSATPAREIGLTPLASLPTRARAFLAVLGIAFIGFGVWLTLRLLSVDSLPVAILLIVLSFVGIVVVFVAVMTIIRGLFSLRAVPFLIGRAVRRLLMGR